MQFHTPETLEIQVRTRKLAEQQMAVDGKKESAKFLSLHKEMVDFANGAVLPAGATSVA